MRFDLINFFSGYFKRIRVLLILMALSSLAPACGGASSAPIAPSSAEQVVVERVVVEAEAPLQPGRGDSANNTAPLDDILAGATVQAQGPRIIIYTGNMGLVVKDTEKAVKAITKLANEQGGYVSGSNIYRFDESPRGNITIRVPADSYQDTLAKLRALALRVEREETGTQDVTEEFTDLEARKTNLEFTEAALQELLDERRRVGSTSDILEVYRELTNIRGQIEQIEGRLRYLANQSALSTITIELTPDVLYQPVSVAGWEPQGVAKEALQALIAALQGLINLLIWLVILILPLLIILLTPLLIIIWFIRWWWGRRKAKKDSTEPVEKVTVESPEQE